MELAVDEAEVVMCGDEDKVAGEEVDGDDDENDIEHSTASPHDHHNGHTHALRAHDDNHLEEGKAEEHKRVDSFTTRPFPLEAAASGLGKSNRSTRSISSSLSENWSRPFGFSWITWSKFMVRLDMFICMVAGSQLYVVMPKVLVMVMDGDYSRASALQGAIQFVERGLTLITAPLLGNFSDMVGRRPVVMFAALGQAASLLLAGLNPKLWSIWVHYVVTGILGTVLATLYAAVTDLARYKDRTGSLTGQFGRAGVALCLGMAIGPPLGGVLSQRVWLRLPLVLSSALMLVVVFTTFCVPETLPKSRRKTSFNVNVAEAFPWRKLLHTFREKRMALLGLPYMLVTMAETVHSTMTLYMMKRYKWKTLDIGLWISATFVLVAVLQGSLKFITPQYISEKKCAVIGIAAHLTGVLIMGLASTGRHALPAIPFLGLAGFKMPSFLSLMTSHASEEKRGVIQGSVYSLRSIALFIVGPVYSLMFSWATQKRVLHTHGKKVMGTPFFLAAAFDSLALLTALAAFYVMRENKKSQRQSSTIGDMSKADSRMTSATIEESAEGSFCRGPSVCGCT